MNQIHWHATQLLDVPPVLVVSEYEPARIRQKLATFVDGRHVNDVLYRAILSIKREHALEPHAYVIVFPREGFEIPIDLRPVVDDAAKLVGFVKEPRGVREVVFDYTELEGKLADALRAATRDEAITVMKNLSADGQEFTLADRCSPDERFSHRFMDGAYRHEYRYVATLVPEIER